MDETRAVAHLPNLDVEILHRQPEPGAAPRGAKR
jgi:hypothetical protein